MIGKPVSSLYRIARDTDQLLFRNDAGLLQGITDNSINKIGVLKSDSVH